MGHEPTSRERELEAEVARLQREVTRLERLVGTAPGHSAMHVGAEVFIDAKVFEDLAEAVGPEAIGEVTGIFLRDMPRAIKDMREAFAAGDCQRLRGLAHPQVSVCHALGARTMSGLLSQLEALAESGQLAGAPKLLDELQTLFPRVDAQLRRLQGEAAPASAPVVVGADGPRILVVEDNPTNLKLALVLLESAGHRADGVGNGRAALGVLEKQRYDVVFMDMMMPIMDGLKTTRAICARWPRGKRPRIIALTGLTSEAERQACFAAGVDDYIPKPLTAPVLAAKLPSHRAPDVAPRKEPVPRTVIHAAAPVMLDPSVLQQWAESSRAAALSVIDVFLKGLPSMLGELRSAMLVRDAPAFTRAAHSLKSASVAVGAIAMANLVAELEALGRAGSVRGVETELRRLEGMRETLERELNESRKQYA